MKVFFYGVLTLLSANVFARPPHEPSPEMRACFQELKSSGQMSESCQEHFKKHDERKAKIDACIASIDNTDTSNSSVTPADDSGSDTSTSSDSQSTADASDATTVDSSSSDS